MQAYCDRIDNTIYEGEGDPWWQPHSALYLLQKCVNPVRSAYLRRILLDEMKISPHGVAALEVGCGGGILSEEIARMGFETVGIDPSGMALDIAARHAREGGLAIRYEQGAGESLPYPDASFGVVFCCDVLEHVRDLPRVIAEIGRVLAPGGVFCYDTVNRTVLSRLVAINIAQKWPRWAFAPSDLHIWEMFITPSEMKTLLFLHQLRWREHRGIGLGISLSAALRCLRKRAKGEWTWADLGEKIRLRESGMTQIMYMGYATKG